MEESFIEINGEAEGDGGAEVSRFRRYITAVSAAAAAVFLFAGGAFAFGKFARGGSPPFLANISPLFNEAFSGGAAAVEIIPLQRGGAGAVEHGGVAAISGAARMENIVPVRGGSPNVNPAACTAAGNPSRRVLISEVAWAGAAERPAAEWIELFNPGSAAIPLAGWQLVNRSGGIRVVFSASDTVAGEGFFLLERKDDSAVPAVSADAFFTNAVKNSDEELELFDERCGLVDEVKTDAGSGKRWSAGGAAPGYRSMERSPDLSWHTYTGVGTNGIFGTPRRENSPAALSISQSETSGEHSAEQNILAASSAAPSSSPTAVSQVPAVGTGRVTISEVMAGMDGNGDYEFVELYNADDHAVDLTGWSVKKRTATAKEESVVSANAKERSASLEGRIILAGRYLLLANSNGYTGAVVADVRWPKSHTLAYKDNAVILYNAAGERVDEVLWTEIPKGSSYARVPVNSPPFAIQVVPTPQNSSD